jgi:diguanylate cyclase (GGDEF)-like protein
MNDSDKPGYRCPIGESHCDYLVDLARLTSRVETLESMTRTDPLTGLFNYRHFAESLDNEMERTRRSGQPTALMMVDLDHFKDINDTWGHETGNLVLTETARQILANLRKLDIGCRYGGEEFAIILPNTQLAKAVAVAERLRLLRRETSVTSVSGETFKVTASYGISLYSGQEFSSAQAFVASADQYLYQAKSEGRDRVCAPAQKMTSTTEVSMDEKRALLE